MKKAIIIIICLLIFPYNLFATETFDCSCGKYSIMIHVGTTGSFANVLLFEEGKKDFVVYPTSEFKNVKLDFEKKFLNLEFISESKSKRSFSIEVEGGSEGILKINNIEYKAHCYWDD